MLVTLDNLKTLGGIKALTTEQRQQYEFLLGVAETVCLDYAGLKVSGSTEETLKGQNIYYLANRPITKVTGVTRSGEDIPYAFNARTGSLIVDTTDEITVAYTYGIGDGSGYDTLKLAIMWLVQYWAKFTNSNAIGETTRTSDVGSVTIEQYDIPLVVKTMLDPYKRQVF